MKALLTFKGYVVDTRKEEFRKPEATTDDYYGFIPFDTPQGMRMLEELREVAPGLVDRQSLNFLYRLSITLAELLSETTDQIGKGDWDAQSSVDRLQRDLKELFGV